MPHQTITVFEHDILRCGKGANELTQTQFEALQRYAAKGVPYFSLLHRGLKFKQFVGVIQVGKTTIEILPKTDKNTQNNEKNTTNWRNILIGMLQAVDNFEIKTPSSSFLKIQRNSILDLYFELFIKNVEFLLHRGLVKKYRKTEENTSTLKGSLQFSKHLQQNLCNQAQFFVRYTVYGLEHELHIILYKTLSLLQKINTNAALHSRIGSLLLNFPEMPDQKVSETTFEKLVFNRKTQVYEPAIQIAKMILLQYHPDLQKGNNHVLALLFDMNLLWEKFVFHSLKPLKKHGFEVIAQTSKSFWKPEFGAKTSIRPDILIKTTAGASLVLDTKWKKLDHLTNPSTDDLRQLYVYHEYFEAIKTALIYPSREKKQLSNRFKNYENIEENFEINTQINTQINQVNEISGQYFPIKRQENPKNASLLFLHIPEKKDGEDLVKQWQKTIQTRVLEWIISSAE